MADVLVALGPFMFYATAPSFDKLKFQADFRWRADELFSVVAASPVVAGLLTTEN